MRLIPLTLSQWHAERRREAADRGYRVVFVRGDTIALFFNGKYLCYTKTWKEPNQ